MLWKIGEEKEFKKNFLIQKEFIQKKAEAKEVFGERWTYFLKSLEKSLLLSEMSEKLGVKKEKKRNKLEKSIGTENNLTHWRKKLWPIGNWGREKV